ncbi:MAG: hypothetical protein Q9227_005931 [Pyrenula ochraceoflavens]
MAVCTAPYTSHCGTKSAPDSLHLPQGYIDMQNSATQNAEAIAVPTEPKDPNPIIIQQPLSNTSSPDANSTPTSNTTIPYIQGESNGDYSIHMDKDLADAVSKVLADQASKDVNCTGAPPHRLVRRGTILDNKESHSRRAALSPQQQQCIQGGITALAITLTLSNLKALTQIVQKTPNVARNPMDPTLQNLLAKGIAAAMSTGPAIASIFSNPAAARALEDVLLWLARSQVVDQQVKDLTTVTVSKQDQDQSTKGTCPLKELLRCEYKGCLNSQGKKTTNEICPPSAQDVSLRGCACSDCADDEYMPFCDNCGGLQPGSGKTQDKGDTDQKQDPGKRVAPPPPSYDGPRCNGDIVGMLNGSVSDGNGSPSALPGNVYPLHHPSDQPDLSGQSDAANSGPTSSSSSLPTASTACAVPPMPSGSQDSDPVKGWMKDARSVCGNCPGRAGSTNFGSCQHADAGQPTLCSCTEAPCQNTKCFLSGPAPPALACPDDMPNKAAAVKFSAWYDKSNNQCNQCPGKAYDSSNCEEIHAPKQAKICKCSAAGECQDIQIRSWVLAICHREAGRLRYFSAARQLNATPRSTPSSKASSKNRAVKNSPQKSQASPASDDLSGQVRFRATDLSPSEVQRVFGRKSPPPTVANHLLRTLQYRRLAGKPELDLPPALQIIDKQYTTAVEDGLRWLRKTYPVDEDAAIMARIEKEEENAVTQVAQSTTPNPKLLERAVKLGLYKPQDGNFGAERGPNDSVYAEGVFDRIRKQKKKEKAEQEAKWKETEQAKLQKEIDAGRMGPMELAPASTYRDIRMARYGNALQRFSERSNEWARKHIERATSNLTLDSPEVVEPTFIQRLFPTFLFASALTVACYFYAQIFGNPQASQRLFPQFSVSESTLFSILGINVAVYLLWNFFPPAFRLLNKYFLHVAATPTVLSSLGSTFSHMEIFHLFANMWGLFIFGPPLHEYLGRPTFLAVYLTSAVLSSTLSLGLLVARRRLSATMIGASGATMGIFACTALMTDQKFSFFFLPKETREKWSLEGANLLLLVVGSELFSTLLPFIGIRTGINNVAHLAGMAVGAAWAWALQNGWVWRRKKRDTGEVGWVIVPSEKEGRPHFPQTRDETEQI